MAQVSIYIDDSLLSRLEACARKENVSLSAWVRARLEESLSKGWNAEFLQTYGALSELNDFERPQQPDSALDARRDSFEG